MCQSFLASSSELGGRDYLQSLTLYANDVDTTFVVRQMYRFVAEAYCICRIGAALLTLNNDLALFDVQALMRIDSNGPIVGKLISDVVF